MRQRRVKTRRDKPVCIAAGEETRRWRARRKIRSTTIRSPCPNITSVSFRIQTRPWNTKGHTSD